MTKISNKAIGILVALLVIGAGTFAYFAAQDTPDNNEESSNSQNQSASNGQEALATFDPVLAEGVSYVATISGTSEGQPVQGTIESDGQGNSKFSFSQGEESGDLYLTSEATYSCSKNEGCVKFDRTNGNTNGFDEALNPSRFDYSEEDFKSFKDQATYEGRQSCPAGTCDTWTVVDEQGYESKIYLDDSNRVSQVEGKDETSNITLTYEYRDVTITPPANAQEIPSL